MRSLPLISRTLCNTESIHEGTPLRLVTFLFKAYLAIRSRFSSKSLNNAISLGGIRVRLTSFGVFSIRIALKSPTRLFGVFKFGV